MSRFKSFFKLFGESVSADLMVLRTRIFVGTANFLPDFDLLSVFVRPVLLRLAGAKVGFPARIRRPLFIHYAGRITIGQYVFINQGLRVEGLADVTIGDSVLIGPFCCFENVNHRAEGSEALPITIGKGVWIGAGSILLPGSHVGEGAVVAAGSVVRGHVPPHETWGGVPARPIQKRADDLQSSHQGIGRG
jgi:maltose O-acetyltransferase